MTRARCELIDLNSTPYYHCICRCVRRAFLCGEDHLTGKNYEHRKTWVVERLTELSRVFAIQVSAFAVLSNHYHIVVRIDRQQAEDWSENQVVRRWKRLFKLPVVVERYIKAHADKAEARHAQKMIAEWRERLMDLSWYMRSLNEHLARKANAEDSCTGRFWEGRYKSQALLDEAAILTCMSYVDLNPIRAGIAETPEASDYTSIQQRIAQWQKTQRAKAATAQSKKRTLKPSTSNVPLMPLVKHRDDRHVNGLGFRLSDYLELVDWAGRAIRDDKRGAIAASTPPILLRLELDPDEYLKHMRGKTKPLSQPSALGAFDKLRAHAEALGKKFIRNTGRTRALYRPRLAD